MKSVSLLIAIAILLTSCHQVFVWPVQDIIGLSVLALIVFVIVFLGALNYLL